MTKQNGENSNPISILPELNLEQFTFDVPPSLIAQKPLTNRVDSRLLVRNNDSSLHHSHVKDLPQLLPQGSLLVLNQSAVFPSRIKWQDEKGKNFELFLLAPPRAGETSKSSLALALGRPMAKIYEKQKVSLQDGMEVVIRSFHQTPFAHLEIEFMSSPKEVEHWLTSHALVPLPPYIKREQALPYLKSPDRLSYQTVYSQEQGSVAAPTAGLHFSKELLAELSKAGIETAYLTLHVGAQTFQPIRVSNIKDHGMHEEAYKIAKSELFKILKAKQEGRKIIVVGTTSLRTLESLFILSKEKSCPIEDLADMWHHTRLFIHPQANLYQPYFGDALMTNFHQSQSTLFVLVCALIGIEEAHKLYKTAIEQSYPFHSYGAASLLWLPKV